MDRLMMAAIGAMIVCALAGCTMHPDAAPVSAMVRTDDGPRVTVELAEIVLP